MVPVKDLPPDRVIFSVVVILVCCRCPAVQVDLVVSLNKTLVENKARHHSNCESAAAESEAKYLVGLSLIVTTDKLVDVDDVALQSDAKSASKNCKWFKARCAYAIVIKSDLIRT